MNVAICHDVLVEFGGSERVLQSLFKLYPKAHVYTGYFDPAMVAREFPGLSKHLHVSFIQQYHLNRWGYLFQPIAPVVWNGFNLERFDLVISNSSYMLSNLVRTSHPIHVQYIQSLPKNIYQTGGNPHKGIRNPLFSWVMRRYEKALSQNSNIIVNSRHSQRTLRERVGISSDVIHPPVFVPGHPSFPTEYHYFLVVSRLDSVKNIELAIRACNKLKIPLRIVGTPGNSGYETFLRSISGPTIKFMGFLNTRDLASQYKMASAFLFTAPNEDFGIAPIEAMAHGVPVVSYYGGGLKETVINGKTGIFFYKNTVESLTRVLQRFDPTRFDPVAIHNHALQYGEVRFKKEFTRYVKNILQKKGDDL